MAELRKNKSKHPMQAYLVRKRISELDPEQKRDAEKIAKRLVFAFEDILREEIKLFPSLSYILGDDYEDVRDVLSSFLVRRIKIEVSKVRSVL